MENLTEIIAEDYKKWKTRDQIWISAPTGIGKTFFILDTFWKYVASSNKGRILIIENRLSLKMQLQTECMKRCGIYKDPLIAQDVRDFKGLTLITYQEMEERYESGTLQEFLIAHDIRYCVFDEVHYIIEDSSFRRQTGLWPGIIKALGCRMKIYMSATLEKFWEYMTWRDKSLEWAVFRSGTCDYYPVEDDLYSGIYSEPKKIWIYNISPSQKHIEPWVYKDYAEIAEKINDDPSDDKWLVFVSNKEKAQKELLPLIKTDKEFVTSDIDTNGTIKDIAENEMFAGKVLVTTKILDNGVNLKDLKLKNIVMSTYSETEFKQMLGRKRWEATDEILNVYLPRKSQEYFQTILNKKINPVLRMFGEDITFNDVLNNEKIYRFAKNFMIVKNGKLEINSAAKAQFFAEQRFVKNMIEKLGEDDMAFVFEQLSWLPSTSTYNKERDLTWLRQVKGQEDIKKFLEKHQNICMDKTEQQKFRETLQNLVAGSGESISKKSNRLAGKAVINRYLEPLGWEIQTKAGKKKGEETLWRLIKM